MNKIPPKAMIERALYKAWKTTPSKNNSMAYQVLVWGPDKEIHKEAIHNLVTKSHRAVEEKAVKEGYQKLIHTCLLFIVEFQLLLSFIKSK